MKHRRTSFPDGFNTDRLPALPHVLLQIIRLCRKPDLNLHRLADAINRDVILAGRVVAAANAAYYNSPDKVTNVERALLVLGSDTIKTLVITLSVKQVFERFPGLPEAFLAEFWRRSLTAALLAKSLAALSGYPNGEEAYFAALLHRTGELVLSVLYGSDFFHLKQDVLDERDQVAQENSRFGLDHLTASMLLAVHWGLDSELIEALEQVASPTTPIADMPLLARLVYGARELSLNRAPCEQQLLKIDELFGLMPPLIAELCKLADTKVEHLARSLQIHVEDSLRRKRQELAEELEIISLLQSTRAHLFSAQAEGNILLPLRQAAAILFKASSSLVFVAEPSSNTLVCEPQPFRPGLEFRVPLQPGNNLVADAFLRRELTSWWPNQENQPVLWADQQVLALLQTPGLVCLPLTHADTTQSVLVLGLQFNLTREQHRLMTLFAEEVVPNAAPDHPSTRPSSSRNVESGAGDRNTSREPWAVIRHYLDVLLRHLEQAPKDATKQSLRSEVKRAANILLNLSLATEETGEPLAPRSLAGLLAQVTDTFADSLFATKKLSYQLVCSEDLPLASGHAPALLQIVGSLLRLTTDLAAEGGQILLRAHHAPLTNQSRQLEILITSEPAPSTAPAPEDPRLRLAQHLATELGAYLLDSWQTGSLEFKLLLPITPQHDDPI